MVKILQKIFLTKPQIYVLNAIEQNADKIEYDYRESDGRIYQTFKIFTDTLNIWATTHKSPQSFIGKTAYDFTKYDDDETLRNQHGYTTLFSHTVYSKMMNEFISLNGRFAMLNKQTEFMLARRHKQH